MSRIRRNGMIISLIGALGLVALSTASVRADDSASREVSVNLNAGESYVIKGLSTGGTPAVHVLNNPNALIVHGDAPGELVLLGAATGQWAIDVKTADGEKVRYNVSVQSIAKPPLGPARLRRRWVVRPWVANRPRQAAVRLIRAAARSPVPAPRRLRQPQPLVPRPRRYRLPVLPL